MSFSTIDAEIENILVFNEEDNIHVLISLNDPVMREMMRLRFNFLNDRLMGEMRWLRSKTRIMMIDRKRNKKIRCKCNKR